MGAGAAGDRELAVLRVVERALDGDLTAGKQRRPVALPGLADYFADAVALVAAHLLRVLRVEHGIGEREDVADVVRASAAAGVCHSVGRRALDDVDHLAVGPFAVPVSSRPER